MSDQTKLNPMAVRVARRFQAASRKLDVDVSKPMETNGVIYFDIDGDDMSLDLRKGETPAKVVEAWVSKHLPEGKATVSGPQQLTLHFKGWAGKPVTTKTDVKIESRVQRT